MRKTARADWFPGLVLLVFYILSVVFVLVFCPTGSDPAGKATAESSPRPWLEQWIENQR